MNGSALPLNGPNLNVRAAAGDAMRDILKAKVEYVTDAAQKSRIGYIAHLSDPQELADVLDH